MTTKWIECITAIGLFLMPPEAQRDRMNRVFAGDTEINGEELAELIDECRNIAGAVLEQHEDSQFVSEDQKNTIREMLELTDGKAEVAPMGSERLAAGAAGIGREYHSTYLNGKKFI